MRYPQTFPPSVSATPCQCNRTIPYQVRRYATLAGFGAAPQPSFASAANGLGTAYNSTTAPVPRSGFVLGSKAAIPDHSETGSQLRQPSRIRCFLRFKLADDRRVGRKVFAAGGGVSRGQLRSLKLRARFNYDPGARGRSDQILTRTGALAAVARETAPCARSSRPTNAGQ